MNVEFARIAILLVNESQFSLIPLNGHLELVRPLLDLVHGLPVRELPRLLPVDADQPVVELEADQLGDAARADLEKMTANGKLISNNFSPRKKTIARSFGQSGNFILTFRTEKSNLVALFG